MELTLRGVPATVADVSASGLRVRSEIEARIGSNLRINFAGTAQLKGRVVWRSPGILGTEFYRRTPSIFESNRRKFFKRRMTCN
jgi:hypothetical protein